MSYIVYCRAITVKKLIFKSSADSVCRVQFIKIPVFTSFKLTMTLHLGPKLRRLSGTFVIYNNPLSSAGALITPASTYKQPTARPKPHSTSQILRVQSQVDFQVSTCNQHQLQFTSIYVFPN